MLEDFVDEHGAVQSLPSCYARLRSFNAACTPAVSCLLYPEPTSTVLSLVYILAALSSC